MKKLLFLSVLLLTSVGRAHAQVGGRATSVVVVEVLDEIDRLTVAITRGPGKSEQTEVKLPTNREGTTARAEAYSRLFQQLYDEEYTLQSSSPVYVAPGASRNTYLFVKAAH